MAGDVHWDLSGKFEFKRNEKCCDHVPESLLEKKDTNPCGTEVCEQIMEMRRGDCTWSISQKEESCKSIIVTIPEDGRVRAREDEKVENAAILRVKLEECVL